MLAVCLIRDVGNEVPARAVIGPSLIVDADDFGSACGTSSSSRHIITSAPTMEPTLSQEMVALSLGSWDEVPKV
jgi:hypothetical protein